VSNTDPRCRRPHSLKPPDPCPLLSALGCTALRADVQYGWPLMTASHFAWYDRADGGGRHHLSEGEPERLTYRKVKRWKDTKLPGVVWQTPAGQTSACDYWTLAPAGCTPRQTHSTSNTHHVKHTPRQTHTTSNTLPLQLVISIVLQQFIFFLECLRFKRISVLFLYCIQDM